MSIAEPASNKQIDWEENDWEILELQTASGGAAVDDDDHHHVCLHHCWKDQCTSSSVVRNTRANLDLFWMLWSWVSPLSSVYSLAI